MTNHVTKINFKKLSTNLFFILLLTSKSYSEDYYVSNEGSDTSNGSQAFPWQSIQHAANQANAGDTIFVTSGNYDEVVVTKSSGQEELPITFKKAENDEQPNVGGFDLRHAWIVVDDFNLTGQGCTLYSGVVSIRPGADNITIKNNTLKNTPSKIYAIWHQHWGIPPESSTISQNHFFDNGFHTLSLRGRDHRVSGNYFENNLGHDAIRVLASDVIISGNEFRNVSNNTGSPNHADIVQSFSVNGEVSINVTFERNLVIDCINTQIGMLEDQKKEGQIRNWTFKNNLFLNVEYAFQTYVKEVSFYNNTFYRCGTNTGHPLLFRTLESRGTADNGRIINNAFIHCGSDSNKPDRGWFLIENGVTGNYQNNNLIIGTNDMVKMPLIGNNGKIGNESINIGHDIAELFASHENLNFTPAPLSPLINSGADLDEVELDYFGNPRNDGKIDIGAIEFSMKDLGLTPENPTNLKISEN